MVGVFFVYMVYMTCFLEYMVVSSHTLILTDFKNLRRLPSSLPIYVFNNPIHTLKLLEKVPYIWGKTLNSVTLEYKLLTNTNSFKISLAKFLLTQNYYSVNECSTDSEH